MTRTAFVGISRGRHGVAAAMTAGAVLAVSVSGARAGVGIGELDTRAVVTGLSRPIFVTAPPGDTSRIFVVEQRGVPSSTQARILPYQINASGAYSSLGTFLTISGVATGNEQGLLGFAFHPDYLNNGYFFVHYNNSGGTTVVARYRANPPFATSNTADAASATTVLTVAQPQSNHNGGWMAFGPDGNMFLALGDGGGANDSGTGHNPSFGNGQDKETLLGKILRLDVDGADNIPGNDDDDGVIGMTLPPYTSPATNPFVGEPGRDEIWSYGLRNPWRNSFDRQTGEMYIADVGQNQWEEINVEPANTSERNYGWRCYEGNTAFNTANCPLASALTFPVHVFSHSADGFSCSVTGGYVYRGTAISGLQGTYFFADYCSNRIKTFAYTGANNPPVTDRTVELAPGGGLSIGQITSFGEDASGELYICDQAGEIFKIVAAPPANDGCNGAITVGVGSTPVTNVNAATDGTDEIVACDFNGYTQVGSDVWYKWPSLCKGTARVSLCGADFNAKLAVYALCPTGPGSVIACSDDFCGDDPEVTYPADSGVVYRIRIGGFEGAQGTGTLVISCDEGTPCPADIAPIGTPNGSVDVDDLLAVINAWGPCDDPPALCPADIAPVGAPNGAVDVDDLLAVINAWGPCP